MHVWWRRNACARGHDGEENEENEVRRRSITGWRPEGFPLSRQREGARARNQPMGTRSLTRQLPPPLPPSLPAFVDRRVAPPADSVARVTCCSNRTPSQRRLSSNPVPVCERAARRSIGGQGCLDFGRPPRCSQAGSLDRTNTETDPGTTGPSEAISNQSLRRRRRPLRYARSRWLANTHGREGREETHGLLRKKFTQPCSVESQSSGRSRDSLRSIPL